MGTSVRHGSSQSLMPRLCSASGGMRSPCKTCFAARCATRARRVRVTNASGHVWMGHVVGIGGVVRDAVLTLGGCAVSSSLDSFAWSFYAPHPIRTGNAGSRVSRTVGAPIRGVARWLPSPRITRSWPWTASKNRAPRSSPGEGCSVLWRFAMPFFQFVFFFACWCV